MSDLPANSEFERIGEQLKGAREAKGLSREAAAERLHCDPRVLVALESGRFEALGAPVFARGHLKRYAELLGLPIDELLAQWSAASTVQAQTPDLARGPQAPRPLPVRQWGRTALALVGAGLLALVIWWILRGNATTLRAPASGSPAVPVALPPLPAQAPELAPELTAEPEQAPAQSAPAAAAVVPDTAPAAAAEAAPATAPETVPEAVPAAGSLPLAAAFTEACWVEIADASGKRLYYGMAPAGGRVRVAGTPPLKVILGVRAAARLEVAGRPVAVPEGPAGLRTARFIVASDGELRAL
jgi:cytoskeleton protein RodZ